MKRFLAALGPIAVDFGPLLVFWLLLYTVDLKIAIGVGVVLILLDGAWRWRTGRPMNRIYLLSSGLTIVFGLIDLYAATPFMLKYEDVITSTVIAGAFAWGARGEKSMIQTLAEQQGAKLPDGPAIRLFFKTLTLVWAGYFLFKAAVYLWIGEILPIQETLTVRPIIGMVSLGAMMLLSWQSAPVFRWARKAGWLGRAAAELPAGGVE